MICPDKLKKEYREKLSEISELSFHKSLFIVDDILKEICVITEKTKYEIALLIDRKGKIVDVVCGDKHSVQLSCEDGGNRYSGYRLIHTHPNGNSALSNMDLSFARNNAP